MFVNLPVASFMICKYRINPESNNILMSARHLITCCLRLQGCKNHSCLILWSIVQLGSVGYYRFLFPYQNIKSNSSNKEFCLAVLNSWASKHSITKMYETVIPYQSMFRGFHYSWGRIIHFLVLPPLPLIDFICSMGFHEFYSLNEFSWIWHLWQEKNRPMLQIC